MARNTQTTQINLNLSASQAKSALSALEKQAKDLKKAMDAAATAGDSAGAKKKQAELSRVNNLIRQMTTQAASAEQVLTRLDRATPRELSRTLSTLTRQMQGMTRGTAEFTAQAEKIRQVRDALAEVREEMEPQPGIWDRIKSAGTGAVEVIKGGLDAVSGLISSGKEAVERYSSMQAEMANVTKYSGLAADEVERLNEEFKGMDTRTSREDLNRLAQDAGRLGKQSVEDILGFVRAADQINVALDDLGDGATLTLSKLTGVFGVEEQYGTEAALLKTGSVINELSQNCSASAPYIAEFTARLGATGSQAKMTIPQIMAYGAVLDTTGMNVEAASTAVSQLITRMFTDPAKYAKAAGLDVKKFTDLLNKDANAALMTLLETLGKAGGMEKLAPMFADMGEKGSNSVKVLGALAGQINAVRAQQEAAGKAFEEGTSISQEAAVQNGTVAASLDKARKQIDEVTVAIGEKLLPIMSTALKGGYEGMKMVGALVSFVMDNLWVVTSLAAAWAAYTIAVNAATIKSKAHLAIEAAHNALLAAKRIALLLVAAAQAALTGNTVRATAAMRAFNAATAAAGGAVGLLVTVISAVVAGLVTWAIQSRKTAAEEEELAKAQRKVMKEAGKEVDALDKLYNKTQDQNLAMAERIAAVKELRRQYPDYFKDLTDEAILAGKAADAYEKLKNSILESARAKGREAMISKLEEDITTLQDEWDEQAEYWTKRRMKIRAANILTPERTANDPEYRLAGHNLDVLEKTYKPQIDRKKEKQESLSKANANYQMSTSTEPETPTGISTTPAGKSKEELAAEKKAAQEAERRRKAAEKKAKEDFKKGLADIEAMRDFDDTGDMLEYRAGFINWRELQQRLHDNEITMLRAKMDYYEKADLADDDDYAAFGKKIEEQKQKWDERRVRLDLKDIKSERQREETQAEIDYATPGSDIYRDEEQHRQRLHEIKIKYLQKEQALYSNVSEEWREKQDEIDQAELDEKLRKQKDFAAKMQTFVDQYSSMAREEKMADEMKVLEAVHEAGLLSEKEYQKALKAIKEKYKTDGSGIAGDTKFSSEWADMTVNIWKSITAFMDDSSSDLLGKIASTAQAAFAVMSAAQQAYSQYSAAQAEYQTAMVSKAFDRQIDAAKNNNARRERLEKQKEKALASIRAKQAKSDFALQVAQAVATTALNAVLAYKSALAAGGPAGLVLAPIAAAMATAAGAIQIATIKKQSDAAIAGYSDGGFTKPGDKDEPAGIVHAGEWVASQKLVNNPSTRPIINMLEHAQRTNTIASIDAGDVSRSIAAPMVIANRLNPEVMAGVAAAAGGEMAAEALQASSATNARLSSAVERLEQRLSVPIKASVSMTGPDGIDEQTRRYRQLLKNSKQ